MFRLLAVHSWLVLWVMPEKASKYSQCAQRECQLQQTGTWTAAFCKLMARNMRRGYVVRFGERIFLGFDNGLLSHARGNVLHVSRSLNVNYAMGEELVLIRAVF